MADYNTNGQVEKPSLQAHVQTYGGVITLLKWGTIVSILIAALVIWLIAT